MGLHDARGQALGAGDVVLDDRGDLWVVPADNDYHWLNWVRADGYRYTKAKAKAVDLGHCFHLFNPDVTHPDGSAVPTDRAAGRRDYYELFGIYIEGQLRATLHARRRR